MSTLHVLKWDDSGARNFSTGVSHLWLATAFQKSTAESVIGYIALPFKHGLEIETLPSLRMLIILMLILVVPFAFVQQINKVF